MIDRMKYYEFWFDSVTGQIKVKLETISKIEN